MQTGGKLSEIPPQHVNNLRHLGTFGKMLPHPHTDIHLPHVSNAYKTSGRGGKNCTDEHILFYFILFFSDEHILKSSSKGNLK